MEWLDAGRYPEPTNSTLFTVINRMKEAAADPDYSSFMETGPLVAGLPLPPFQRGLVWAEDRMVRFIDSARRCLPLGSYTVNATFGLPEAKRTRADGSVWYLGEGWLLDGQQRLSALERFFTDRLRVHGKLWSEIGKDEQRGFLMSAKFPYVETSFTSEADAGEYYDLMNFGGVAHTEDERAVPRP